MDKGVEEAVITLGKQGVLAADCNQCAACFKTTT